MTRVSLTLIVCLIAASSAAQSPQPAPGTGWRVAARLMTRTGGGHLEESKGFLVSDPLVGRVGFEAETADGFAARYDRITGLHSESGEKHPGRLFNKDVEFYLTIRYTGDDGGRLVSTGVGGLSAGYSVGLGAIVHPLNKSHEVYLGGGGARGASAAVRVGPLLTRQRRGIAVSVTF